MAAGNYVDLDNLLFANSDDSVLCKRKAEDEVSLKESIGSTIKKPRITVATCKNLIASVQKTLEELRDEVYLRICFVI